MTDTFADGFWGWAVASYAKPGLAEASLRLQDEYGQCVPLLLWAAWAGRINADTALEAALLARAWRPVIDPLRDVRRRLKTEVSAGDETDRLALRAKVKAVELQAEKALMTRLEAVGGGEPASDFDRAGAVAKTVDAWGEPCPKDALDAWLALL